MKHIIRINIFFTLCFSCISLSQTPKHEVRAVWLSAASGDWPKSTNMMEQQESLIEIFDLLERNNFNTIFFQARLRGNTLYQSDIEPWAQQLTGVLGKDPGWDPLQFAIDEAHKRGMELHAWFNVAKVWGLDTPPLHPKHVMKLHPDWVRQVEGEWWIDLGIPEVRKYTLNVVLELISKYDIDGIQFDFIRYPNEAFDDWESFSKWSDGVERNEWRRNNITSFVRECYTKISELKPKLKIGSAPLGIYRAMNGAQSSFTGYDGVFQDSRAWLKEGIHDYLAPQLYWTIGEQQNPNDPDFSILCYDWMRESYGRHIYAGIGIYRENVQQEVGGQVAVTRNINVQGESYFSYEQLPKILSQLGNVYRFPALIPPMLWKDSIPPMSPTEITVKYGDGNLIRWKAPQEASDGEKPFRYVIYRSTGENVDTKKAENILAVIPGERNSYFDLIANESEEKKYYTITSLDRLWNESVSDSNAASTFTEGIPSGMFGEMTSRYSKPVTQLTLSQNYPNPFSSTTYISFEIPQRSKVTLSLIHQESKRETVIVNEIKNAGVHIVAIDGTKFPSGEIGYRLIVENDSVTRTMMKE